MLYLAVIGRSLQLQFFGFAFEDVAFDTMFSATERAAAEPVFLSALRNTANVLDDLTRATISQSCNDPSAARFWTRLYVCYNDQRHEVHLDNLLRDLFDNALCSRHNNSITSRVEIACISL